MYTTTRAMKGMRVRISYTKVEQPIFTMFPSALNVGIGSSGTDLCKSALWSGGFRIAMCLYLVDCAFKAKFDSPRSHRCVK